ncbi:hypothetical protein [Brevundimonas sp. A19_0]|uniref:hypothetical protein n=1 Tax=Brevundimonas sp. A19_0 TaxID=2821087 RepID=UPI001AD9729E|nr:hypothetical protein [Brevundimonas sp. A19_0]MBO9502628.1 hypothetical protein [Brevundimonas sp. A19_0]
MKRVLASLTLGAALVATSAPAFAQDPVPEIDRKDMECAALFALMAGSDPQYQASGAMGMAYFIGRLEGRNPGTNQVQRFSDWVNSQDEASLLTMIDTAGERCATEMETLGTSMTTVGSAGA